MDKNYLLERNAMVPTTDEEWRRYFAGQALIAILSSTWAKNYELEKTTKTAFGVGTAMVKEMNRKD